MELKTKENWVFMYCKGMFIGLVVMAKIKLQPPPPKMCAHVYEVSALFFTLLLRNLSAVQNEPVHHDSEKYNR